MGKVPLYETTKRAHGERKHNAQGASRIQEGAFDKDGMQDSIWRYRVNFK